jgi:hypothetical protein
MDIRHEWHPYTGSMVIPSSRPESRIAPTVDPTGMP